MESPVSILLFCFLSLAGGEIRMSLDANIRDGSWTVSNQNKSIHTAVKVPGGIYTDLQAAGILREDLFYRFNDIEYRWVAKENWTYQTVFQVPPVMMNKSAVNLVFHGIDTVGDVYLNGKLLANVNNMFVRYVLPIKKMLINGNNTLQVRLKSPIEEANKLSEIQKRKYPVPPECTPKDYNGECHVNFLRKMQASFSWDWGPAFPSLGIWKSVEIEAFDLGVIRDVTASAFRINATMWQMNTTAHIEYADDFFHQSVLKGYLTTTDTRSNNVMLRAVVGDAQRDSSVKNGYVFHPVFFVDQDAIEEWWPNGFGKQPLFDVTISLESIDNSECSVKTVKIGFRTIELVQEELQPGKTGRSFYFKVNDVPIFAKGSNWIPGHVLPELGYNESMIRHALESARDANMNMLRVWGGGVYESDTFYSIADELGILIWQDMMFACSMYPTDDKFLKSVETEVEQQIRRMHHHPSIAIWAGNNENEAALTGNWYGTAKNFTLYKEDYVKLYVDTIKETVLANDKSRPYITSSPTNGVESEKEGYVAKDPYSPLFGDVHYYNYIFDGWNDMTYPDTRFASEYGFQSMPSFKSMSKVSLPEDRTLSSNFTAKRQHLPLGNVFMTNSILLQFSLPDDDGSEEFYKTYIYYSQVSQAMSTKTETEKYRRDRGKLTQDNKGHTMGAMYWQLNDVWQAPSWSSIEFGGKWKMLHYYAKKFFSPVLISIERTRSNDLNVFLISDLLEDVPNVRVNVSIYSWDDFTPRKVLSSKVTLDKANSKIHETYDMYQLLSDSNCDKHSCFIYFSLEGPNIFSDNIVYPSKISQIVNLQKPNISVDVKKSDNQNEVKVHLKTDKIAPFVWLETDEEGEFSDNGFMLLKREAHLTFKGRQNKTINVNKIKSSLSVRSVYKAN